MPPRSGPGRRRIRSRSTGTPISSEVVIGPAAKKPLRLEIPLLVSDMSFGALSEEAKTALSMGAELAGTGICSGEGGMLPEEQQANSRYFYELASGRFGYAPEKLDVVQAFHFKCGQAAKTGTGGHLPGHKVMGKIAEVRGLPEGQTAVSPARFPDWDDLHYYKDFAKGMALGADAVACANASLQAIGCLGMRACHTNNCPVGIATQKRHLRDRLPVKTAAQRLDRFFRASVDLMEVLVPRLRSSAPDFGKLKS